jgi:hypothetical protein
VTLADGPSTAVFPNGSSRRDGTTTTSDAARASHTDGWKPASTTRPVSPSSATRSRSRSSYHSYPAYTAPTRVSSAGIPRRSRRPTASTATSTPFRGDRRPRYTIRSGPSIVSRAGVAAAGPSTPLWTTSVRASRRNPEASTPTLKELFAITTVASSRGRASTRRATDDAVDSPSCTCTSTGRRARRARRIQRGTVTVFT